jgi:hypothetical protein
MPSSNNISQKQVQEFFNQSGAKGKPKAKGSIAPKRVPSKPKPTTYTPGTGGGMVSGVMAKKAKIDKAIAARPKTEAAKQLSALTQPMSARKVAEAKKKIEAIKGRRAAASTPSGRGASAAASKKNKPGTVTRGKSNFVLDNLRRAAGRG